MQKIFINKNDTAVDVVKYLKTSNEGLVMLVIPTDSKLKTLASFRNLKKKSSEMGKNLIIESVDETVLSLANAASLEAIHPFLSNYNNRSLADIVVTPIAKRAVAKGKGKSKKAKPLLLHVKGISEHAIPIPVKRSWKFKMPLLRRMAIPLAVFLTILFAGVLLNVFFTKAEIVINFEKIPWQLEHGFTASTSLARDATRGYTVPGQLLKQQKNMAQLFPASGRGVVSEKAKTKITIYNAFSEDSQRLVATTRFMAPDGKIFRIDSDVLIPGATKQDGKLVPSSVKVNATAAAPGPEYNIGPIVKMDIPGFLGSPRYEGFYGAMEEKATGGFVGEKAIATNADVAAAEKRAAEIFKAAFENTFLTMPPDGLRIIDGASELRILKLNVDRITTPEGNFTVLGEAEFRSVAFREQDLVKLLESDAFRDYPGSKFEAFSISYRDARPNFITGSMDFIVTASGTITPDFNTEEFKTSVLGKSENEVHSLVLSIPHLTDARISLLPFWVKRLPVDKERVRVRIE